MFEGVESLLGEHAELERRLALPETHADPRTAKTLNQRYAELTAIITTWRDWKRVGDDLSAAVELSAEDAGFADEVRSLTQKREVAEERLRRLLVPRDPVDDKDAILEIKSGEGGEESALFAGDLLRMYTRYAERVGWSTEVLDATESDLGGYKSVTVAVKSRGVTEPGHTPYGLLRFEGGVHRVQRVPVTESQGRVHTSAAGVLVLPEAEAVEGMRQEHADIEQRLALPETHADQRLARELNQRYAELTAVVTTWQEWLRLGDDIEAARELASDDPAFAQEADDLAKRRDAAGERLRRLLVPRDAADGKDALLEIKSGEGGEESALFAGDLLRMYSRYAETRGWSVEVLDATESDLGGYKSVTAAVKARGTVEPGQAPYALLKFEGGVHRVQRVPVTESQGRVHTSAAGVLVMPEAEQVDVEINDNDLRIDVYRSSGPGGQSVNTTDSAVRITHLPTGIVASCQNEKSQLQNKESAMRILRGRLLQAAQDAADAEASDARRSQVRTVDRSERIRTYNYPENRISDNRTGYKSYNLDQVLDGDLQPVLDSCVETDMAARLAALEG